MTFDLLTYLAAAAGGFLGAAFGALVAFVFAGFAVVAGVTALIGTGNPAFLDNVALSSR